MGVPKHKWTRDEETALKAGIAKHGAGKWRKILRDLNFSRVLHLRSNIDLKDKWRNMSITANRCGSRRKNILVQNESPMALSTGVNIDNVAIDAFPLAVSYVSTPNSRPQGPIKRLNGLSVETVSSLKEPGSSNTTNIAALIEDQYAAPPNFKPLVKFLTASDKLVKPKQESMSALEAKPRATSETDKDEILIPTKAEIDLDLKLETDKDEIYIPTQAEINLELEKMRHMTPEDAATAAARAVADAEAAVAAAEEAMREAEAAEAEAAEAEAIAEACMKEVAQRNGGKKTSSLAVGGNGAEQTVVSGSMEVLRPCWAVATSGVPVREQLFNASICHHSYFNLFQHGEFARSFSHKQDVSSLEVATPILIPRNDGHHHRKGSHGDVVFLTNRGELKLISLMTVKQEKLNSKETR